MKHLMGIGFVLLLVTVGCTPPEMLEEGGIWDTPAGENGGGTTEEATPETVAEGQALYDMYCLSCHGPEGTGAAVWPGSIQGIDPIHDIVADGRGQMPPVALDDSQIAAIQAYLNSFGVDLTSLSGEELFAAQCASCHGANGEGNMSGPVIQFAHREYGEWVIRNGRDGAGYPGAMPAYATDQVSEQQLQEIFTFLHGQTRPTTGEDLYHTFCSHCHGDQGAGGTTGEEVGGHEDVTEVIQVGKGGTNYSSRTTFMPGWGNEISSAEIDLISNYVGSLPEL